MRRYSVIAISLVVALMLVSVVVIAVRGLPGNQVSSTVAGRSVLGISADRGSAAHLNADNTTATVQLGGHTVRVTADAVELPGGRSVPIPVTCKAVELREEANRVRVYFDGIEAP